MILFLFLWIKGLLITQINSQRVWYFENNLIEKNSNRERANTIIYYSQMGKII